MAVLKLEKEPSRPEIVPVSTANDFLKTWMEEIDGYYKEMQHFTRMEPDEIFGKLSSWTARVSHMRSLVNRSESKMRQSFRTKQIDPFIVECDRQFKIWSRVFSVVQMDFDMGRRTT